MSVVSRFRNYVRECKATFAPLPNPEGYEEKNHSWADIFRATKEGVVVYRQSWRETTLVGGAGTTKADDGKDGGDNKQQNNSNGDVDEDGKEGMPSLKSLEEALKPPTLDRETAGDLRYLKDSAGDLKDVVRDRAPEARDMMKAYMALGRETLDGFVAGYREGKEEGQFGKTSTAEEEATATAEATSQAGDKTSPTR